MEGLKSGHQLGPPYAEGRDPDGRPMEIFPVGYTETKSCLKKRNETFKLYSQ